MPREQWWHSKGARTGTMRPQLRKPWARQCERRCGTGRCNEEAAARRAGAAERCVQAVLALLLPAAAALEL